ncbi:MFS transporter [Rhodoluna limnophila]|uniref:MFS transporter n=1 Tax=Rhodoluna limnophila TaxID=232537 RepID=UPI00110742AB|nr:MFS transporter [Rhodoluna limnophila]
MNLKDLDYIQRRTVKVLTVGQVLGGFGLGSTLSIGSLLAAELSGSPAWAGAAATFSTLGAATWAIPLARLAFAKGRRVSLASGAALAISGAALVIAAAAMHVFPLLLVALFLLGGGSAVGLQARFAATDVPTDKPKARDLSIVVWATTVGAVVGPNMFGPGEVVGQALGLPTMTGPFLFTILAQISATTVFWFGLRPDPLLLAKELNAETKGLKPKVSFASALATLQAYPLAKFAVISIALSHMVMVSVMAMTPIHMQHLGYDLVVVGFTISLHIAGMYAFSPVFGWFADKFGRLKTVLLGQMIFVFALGFAGFGSEDRFMVTVGLFLLGLGWSAATVAGSALLAESLPADEKTNVQGLSDSSMNLAGALGGGLAGSVLAAFAFIGVNVAALVPVVIIVGLGAFGRLERH